jgi:hypothetical protein
MRWSNFSTHLLRNKWTDGITDQLTAAKLLKKKLSWKKKSSMELFCCVTMFKQNAHYNRLSGTMLFLYMPVIYMYMYNASQVHGLGLPDFY